MLYVSGSCLSDVPCLWHVIFTALALSRNGHVVLCFQHLARVFLNNCLQSACKTNVSNKGTVSLCRCKRGPSCLITCPVVTCDTCVSSQVPAFPPWPRLPLIFKSLSSAQCWRIICILPACCHSLCRPCAVFLTLTLNPLHAAITHTQTNNQGQPGLRYAPTIHTKLISTIQNWFVPWEYFVTIVG